MGVRTPSYGDLTAPTLMILYNIKAEYDGSAAVLYSVIEETQVP